MKKNVIFICCDCLRADRIHDYHRDIIPNIRQLMSESVYFTNAFSVGPNTPNSYPSIFGGIYPSETTQFGRIPKSIRTVAEAFSQNGYETFGLNAGNAWLSQYYGYDRGFSHFRSYLNLSNQRDSRAFTQVNKFTSSATMKTRNITWKFLARSPLLTRMLTWIQRKSEYYWVASTTIRQEKELEETFFHDFLELIDNINQNEPVFIWAHFMTTHWPLVPLSEQKFSSDINVKRANYFPKDSESIDLYDDCVLNFDSYIGETINLLKSKSLYEDTIIIITGDHGELLGNEQEAGTHSRRHPSELIPELLHIPLIIKFDKQQPRGQIDEMFSIIGLFKSLFLYLDLQDEISDKTTSFHISNKKISVKNNDYLFCEARTLPSPNAFTTLNHETGEVDKYGIFDGKYFLKYNSKSKTYEGIEEEREKQSLSSMLTSHIEQNLSNREKYRIKNKIAQIKTTDKK